jgi:chemotaxis methyl-accepting protein methylase
MRDLKEEDITKEGRGKLPSSRTDMGLVSKKTAWLQTAVDTMCQSSHLRRYLGRPYLRVNMWIWNHLPSSLSRSHLGWAYGAHLHQLIQLRSERRQYMGTFFCRNRPELELLTRLLNPKQQGSTLDLTILGCSKGAEVYSFAYSIRSARPDLNLRLHALDIDPDVVQFAKEGIYSLKGRASGQTANAGSVILGGDLTAKTFGDQMSSMFERMSSVEIDAMFERRGDQVSVKPRFREALTWQVRDAGDPKLVDGVGLQDIVVANRFLCHMQPGEAEACLRTLANLVKPGGYLFVSGVDLEVRTKVARELGWIPVTELIREIHEGDPSLRNDWPLQYWGLEPFDRRRSDWDLRYASAFQLGLATDPSEIVGVKPEETFVHGNPLALDVAGRCSG